MAAGRLSGLDTAFLCLDYDVSPMHLGGLAIFQPVHPVDPERVVGHLLADRVQRLPRLRQRVQWPGSAGAAGGPVIAPG
jgi:diacylglycerol O-acyltransferase / wax synthase